MLLVIVSLDDRDALWFAQQAMAAGVDCTVLTTEALSFARRRSHRVSDAGISTSIEVSAGLCIDDWRLSGVLNRSLGAPDRAWQRAAPAERDYASAELHAFMVSWLAGLRCPVRNRPTPQCLAGPAPHPFVATAAAARAGLLCPPLTTTTAEAPLGDIQLVAARLAAGAGSRPVSVPCVDGSPVVAGVPDDVATGIARFLALVGAAEAVVGIDFLVAGGKWWFAGMTPLPSLRDGGQAMVERLLATFASEPVRAAR